MLVSGLAMRPPDLADLIALKALTSEDGKTPCGVDCEADATLPAP